MIGLPFCGGIADEDEDFDGGGRGGATSLLSPLLLRGGEGGVMVLLPSLSSVLTVSAVRIESVELDARFDIDTPPDWPFSSSEKLVPLPLNPVAADELDSCLSRLIGSPALTALDDAAVVAVEVCDGTKLLPAFFPDLAALSLALTRAASASLSEAANLAAMRAMLSGDCCAGGRTPALRNLGRREADLVGERTGESTGRLVPEVDSVVVAAASVLRDGGWVSAGGFFAFEAATGVDWFAGEAFALLVGRGGGGILTVLSDVGAGRDLVVSDLDGAVRADEDAVAAVARVDLCRVSGLDGGSFFSCAVAALVLLVTGLVTAKDVVSFVDDTSDRADLVVTLLGSVETEDSGDCLGKSILSSEESDSVKTWEVGRDLGFSSCLSVDTFNLFWGDCPGLMP